MGIFSFLRRKKKEDLGALPNLDSNLGMPNLRPTADFQRPNLGLNPNADYDYITQLILSKLELINSRLQNIEQRIVVIEKIAKESQEPEKKWQSKNLY